MSDMKL